MNVDLLQLNLEVEFFTNNEFSGAPVKMVQVSDGYALAGTYRQLDNNNTRKAWIMKIDDDFQQEWYTELSYDDAPGNAHYPYDMEQTSDEGYVVVGAYRNSADFYDRTWLVKVDACGDMEWQGCEPVGIGEFEIQDSKLEVYPNPVSDVLHIQTSDRKVWDQIRISDILGRELINERIVNSMVDLSELNTGLYVLTLYSKGLPIHSQKILKE